MRFLSFLAIIVAAKLWADESLCGTQSTQQRAGTRCHFHPLKGETEALELLCLSCPTRLQSLWLLEQAHPAHAEHPCHVPKDVAVLGRYMRQGWPGTLQHSWGHKESQNGMICVENGIKTYPVPTPATSGTGSALRYLPTQIIQCFCDSFLSLFSFML